MSIAEETTFFWKDLSGRGFSSSVTLQDILDGHGDDEDDDEFKEWAECADVGDEYDGQANYYIRTK